MKNQVMEQKAVKSSFDAPQSESESLSQALDSLKEYLESEVHLIAPGVKLASVQRDGYKLTIEKVG